MYSILRMSSDPKVIGIKNGGSQGKILKQGFSKNNYETLMEHWGSRDSWKRFAILPPNGIYLEHIKLLKAAIKTDFMNISPAVNSSIIISKRTKEIFDKYIINNAIYLRAYVYENEIKYEYYLFYMDGIDNNWINYSKSILTKSLFDNTDIHIENYDDYKSIKKEHVLLRFVETTLNSNFSLKIDLFKSIGGEIYISDKLKHELISNNITGINILPRSDDSNWPRIQIER